MARGSRDRTGLDTARLVVKEHNMLDRAMLTIEEALDDRAPGAKNAKLSEAILGLGRRLETHFYFEEASGMYTAVPGELPEYRAKLNRLRQEHVTIVEDLRHVIEDLRVADEELPASAVDRTRALLKKIRAHEEAEETILATAERRARADHHN